MATALNVTSTDEERVVNEISRRSESLVALASTLIGFDTTARTLHDPPRDERALQEYLGERLAGAGAEVDIWEPSSEDVAGRQVRSPPGFDGRPQLAAVFAGDGDQPSLLFNGHIDAVSYEPRDKWDSPPLAAEVRNGRLYGRGACDMKGGVAAMVFAAETLASLGVELAGALTVNTVTDEESSGAGGIAAVAHGVVATAAVVPEPTDFEVWIACRGTLTATITVPGRAGHAELSHPHWQDGGAVNAIEKTQPILAALERLREEWRLRADHQHPHVAPGIVVPTMITGGEWFVTYPASCEVVAEIAFPPSAADDGAWGDSIRGEITAAIQAAAETDSWLRANPPTISWGDEYPASQVQPHEPIVELAVRAARDVARSGRLAGLDSWHDGATFTRAGCPAICLGPGGTESAHTVNEYVPVTDLVAVSQALALIAMRHCGTA